jgi:hypothetical protein
MSMIVRVTSVLAVVAMAVLLGACAGQSEVVDAVANPLVREADLPLLRAELPVARRPLAAAPLDEPSLAGLRSERDVTPPAQADLVSQRLSADVDDVARRAAATAEANAAIQRCTSGAMKAVGKQYAGDYVGGRPLASLDETFDKAMSGCLAGAYPGQATAIQLVTEVMHARAATASHQVLASQPTALQYYSWLESAYSAPGVTSPDS